MAGRDGGWECGAVRYRMADDPKFVNCCHCRQCQKITGSAFAINGMIEADRISLLQGENKLATSDRQARCTDCNALLWGTHRLFGDGIKFVRIGTLDDAERTVPEAHFFVRSKHPWVAIPRDVAAFQTLPMERDPPLTRAEASARPEPLRGG